MVERVSPSDRNSIELQQQDILRQNQLQREALERSQTVRPSLPSAGVVNQGPCFDRWFVSGARSSAFANDHDAQSVQAGVSIPYGYGLLDYNYAYSNYLTTINNRGYDWRSRGDTQTHRVTGSWTVYRDSDMKTALILGLTRRSSQNYLNDERLDSSSRVLTSAMLGINHSFRLWRGFATFNPTFNRGIPWLGGEHDTDKAPHSPQAEFTKWTLSSSYYLPLTESLTYLTSAYGQWTPDRLYGSERLTIGGESSVRGFKEQYLAGDKGG